MSTEEEIRSLVCELCRQFYQLGWVTGTGGSISIRQGEKIFMTPSGVQKERIKPEELFVVNKAGEVVDEPAAKPGCNRAKLSDCAPLFLHAYNQRDAGAVLHSHGANCNLVTMLFDGQPEFRITQQEMIKGIEGHGFYDELVIPIIENTAWEHELADSLGEAIAKHPKACAVLVRQHGMYVWGKTWEQAKRHGECLHYLFDVFINAHKLGLSHLITKGVAKKSIAHKHLLLDIEGTISPITFVKDVLFPYSVQKVRSFLESNWTKPEIQALVSALVSLSQTETNATALTADASVEDVARFVELLVQLDRKVGPLKALQGLIWQSGYASGDLQSVVFDDVPAVLASLSQQGVKISIYSSGSRQAQHLLCQYSNHGDLRKYLTAYFDTAVGLKGEQASYEQIALTLGVDKKSDFLFVTDILAEAKAAAAAGFDVCLSMRAGNAEISEAHEFRAISCFAEL